ncbi:MAG: Ldh family oxidoreductase, partial [Ramlibacter sp.]
MSVQRYDATGLVDFATRLLLAMDLPEDKATAVAEILVEGDLMGHTTHGLALLGPYLKGYEADTITRDGEPVVVADTGAAVTWDGRRLPGPWL